MVAVGLGAIGMGAHRLFGPHDDASIARPGQCPHKSGATATKPVLTIVARSDGRAACEVLDALGAVRAGVGFRGDLVSDAHPRVPPGVRGWTGHCAV
ncbi:hypothetical protein [Kitasatospora phosalacinea]|uniref:hypothetical protein n=1 Tax=Kitasatospora phosalacinea TaxID=2065 RepID=UPI0005275E8B|nr:hypothetical protein [Kitasatospora phosalacinea]